MDEVPPSSIASDFDYASRKEVRWWKAIVAQGVAWSIVDGGISPWVVPVADFGIDILGDTDHSLEPPIARESACFLSRLCNFYDLGKQTSAALAAVLAIPLPSRMNSLKSVEIEVDHGLLLDEPRPLNGTTAPIVYVKSFKLNERKLVRQLSETTTEAVSWWASGERIRSDYCSSSIWT